LKVATLNTWLLQHAEGAFQPAPDRNCRGLVTGIELGFAGLTPEKDYDVVLLQEGFDHIPTGGLFCGASAAGVCRQLCQEYWFRRVYPGLCDIPGIEDRVEFPWHYRHLPKEKGVEINGGLGTLSKLPITFQHNEPWERCGGGLADCLAQKGFLHFRVRHPSMSSPLDFVTLHTNANYHEPGKEHYGIREQQLIQLYRELQKYPNSTFIIGGDFNIVGPPCHGDACNDEWEYDQKLQPALRLAFPSPSLDAWHTLFPTDPGFTADECTNTNRSQNCSTGRRERIDYIWYNHSNNCYELELVDTSINEFTTDQCQSRHLSDHFGLAAKFNVWKKAGANNCWPADPDGGANRGTPPEFEPIPSEHVVYVGESVKVTVAATETEGDRIEISILELPNGALFNSTPGYSRVTADVTWTPGIDQVGSYVLAFVARDSRGARATATTTLRVLPCRARLDLAAPSPLGPYQGGEVVTVRVADACGDNLQLSWRFWTWQGAGYTVVSGCENGPLNLANATTCTIQLSGGATDARLAKTKAALLAVLAPEKSVDVIVEGRDASGGFVSGRVSLKFMTTPPCNPCDP
jgi:endonuclease/exonuclease/phosphatase family metal-dependent hydrolase